MLQKDTKGRKIGDVTDVNQSWWQTVTNKIDISWLCSNICGTLNVIWTVICPICHHHSTIRPFFSWQSRCQLFALCLWAAAHISCLRLSACYQLSFWISHRVGSLEHLKSVEQISTYFFSHLAQNLWDVATPPLLWRCHRCHSTMGFTIARIVLRCSSTALAPVMWDQPRFEEQIAQLWAVSRTWMCRGARNPLLKLNFAGISKVYDHKKNGKVQEQSK